jgi:nitric oxide reductase NorQ protein
MATTKEAPVVDEHPLAHLVPDAEFYDTYVQRRIGNVTDMKLLQYAQRSAKNVLMFGDTGPGKTAMVMAFAAKHQLPLVTVACNGGIDPNSFFGSPVPDPEVGIKYQYSDVTEIIRHGRGVLYLDEPNFMPPKTAAVFHTLLDRRRFITIMDTGNEVVHAGEGLLIVGTYNPDYEGTRPLNAAFRNRFKLQLHIDYDKEVESQLVFMPVVLELADSLRTSRKNGDFDTPVSTNMLIEFEELIADLGLPFAVENFISHFSSEEREAVKAVLDLRMTDMQEQADQMLADDD